MTKKIIIAIQLGSLNNYNLLIQSLLEYDNSINLFLISVDKSIKQQMYQFTNQIVTYHDNVGMDIGPFILQLKYIFEHNLHNVYTHIYKIHSKSNEKWLRELLVSGPLTEPITCQNKWLKPIDHYNKKTILYLCSILNIPNIFYDDLYKVSYNKDLVDIDFYESYYDISVNKTYPNLALEHILMHAQINGNAINESQIKVKRRKNVKFVAGSIFISTMSFMCNLFLNKDLDLIYFLLEPEYSTNDKPTYVHALERIISSHINGSED